MRADVAVVGAGPAGSWTAYCLARRGATVLLIDGSHPREKPCGGGVTSRALSLVAPALSGFDLPTRVIRTARFVESIDHRSASVALDVPAVEFPPDLVVASRADFDVALLGAAREAGAELIPARVRDVAADGEGFRIEAGRDTLFARYLVGADGVTSTVRRRMARPFTREQLSIATGWFAHGPTSDEIVIELVADPPGYIWSFPRPKHLAIGICAELTAGVDAIQLRERLAKWIEATGIAPGARLQPYTWPIPSLSEADLAELSVSGSPGWFLVGDATGLVDPITREGIYFALAAAEWAADAIASGQPYMCEMYDTRIRQRVTPELAHAAQLKTRFFSRPFAALMMDAIAASEPIRRVAADLIAGRQCYETLKWRLVRTFEIGVAFRLWRHFLDT
jgi:geranylgeranyl reductase family protein